ncbi:MAG TPA: hypothetical protein VK612_06425 [Pyrinomonadaceae bacterium]|nr:hypothetical protein [Pyrinomonadaceae bacterium]
MFNDKESEELLELIRKIAVRPAMYVGEYDFLRATAFIEGFRYARGNRGTLDNPDILMFFSLWLSEKLDRPKNWAWFGTLKEFYKEDEKAFEMQPKHFEEFLKTSIATML